jgi:hypothetical protein
MHFRFLRWLVANRHMGPIVGWLVAKARCVSGLRENLVLRLHFVQFLISCNYKENAITGYLSRRFRTRM